MAFNFFNKKKKKEIEAADTGYPSQEGNGKNVTKLAAMAKRSKGRVNMDNNRYDKE